MSIFQDLRLPFFRRSFVVLLLLDIAYASLYAFMGYTNSVEDAFRGIWTWFVFFYLLPVWGAALIILARRRNGKTNIIIEWFTVVAFMSFGNQVVSWILEFVYDYPGGLNMGAMVVFNGILWGTCLYASYAMFEYRSKAAKQKQATQKAQLQTLRYQLNPHFMFNSLNTISSYIHTDPNLADEVLHKLADVLRYSLDTGELELVSVKKEVELVNTYLAIEEARFGERLKVEFTIDDAALNKKIPPLLLQPIIENCFKHCRQVTNLHIQCRIELKQDKLHISIKDNGSGFSSEVLALTHQHGIGIKNLQQRVAMQPQGKLQLSNDGGAQVQIIMQV